MSVEIRTMLGMAEMSEMCTQSIANYVYYLTFKMCIREICFLSFTYLLQLSTKSIKDIILH